MMAVENSIKWYYCIDMIVTCKMKRKISHIHNYSGNVLTMQVITDPDSHLAPKEIRTFKLERSVEI